jgi:hypothetical protein
MTDAPPIWHFHPGACAPLAALPAHSIALDGYVSGPAMDPEHRRFSFDHHGDCVRHATLSTCEQVRDALRVGLAPAGMTLWLNNIDADSVLALWLLLRPDVARRGAKRVEELIHAVGRRDALGPAWTGPAPSIAVLPRRVGPEDGDGFIRDCLARLDAWERGELVPGPAPVLRRGGGLYLDDGDPHRLAECAGFPQLYEHASFGVLHAPAPNGTTAYTVGKQSDFVVFDLRRFYELCNEEEEGWGGGSSIGGAPRAPDGSRSRLSLDQVEVLLRRAAPQNSGPARAASQCRTHGRTP